MTLPKKQIERFARLHSALAEFARLELKLPLPSLSPGKSVSENDGDAIAAIRDSLHASPKIINKFVRKNPASFTDDDLEVISSWKRAISGGFFVLEHKARHSLFMESDDDFTPGEDVYAVCGLTEPLVNVVGESLPIYVRSVLLPFEGRIIFDGLLLSYPVDLGGAVRQALMGCLEYIKMNTGIITTLDDDAPSKSQRRKR